MAAETAAPRLVQVAVPVPLFEALTYTLPPRLAKLALEGSRVRVPVGRRRLVGVIVGFPEEAPEGVNLRPIEELLDARPVLTPELLDLARFTADYYLAPLGEVVRAMTPLDAAPWGDRRIWLTDAGALSEPRGEAERQVVEALLASGRTTLGKLAGEVDTEELLEAVEALREAGRVTLAEPGGFRGGARYATAVELANRPVEALHELAGRSRPGRQVIDYLDAVKRPATVAEIEEAVGCKAGVVRRLSKLGALRRFQQIERLGLDHHLMAGGPGPEIELRPDQAEAARAMIDGIAGESYRAFLLGGVTGSGKTEVYLRAAAAALDGGRGAIVMVPEIALVPALARTLRERFGGKVAILHSGLTPPERRQEWERLREGEARIVLGPRSAVFAPVRRLGLVVVDEEQDGSYKQDQVPRYNGRDLALVRARAERAVAVLVSATPSLETRHNLETGKVASLRLTERVGQGELPEGVLVDLRAVSAPRTPGEIHFSDRLLAELEATLAAGHQAILLRNRRGFSPVLLCRACGEDLRCDDCGLPRTFHRREARLVCHYCGSRRPEPRQCPTCGAEAMEAIGAGTERVEERFRELFPGVPVDVLDRDAVRRKGSVAAVLERFGAGETRVLVGTQMVSKGHHFPGVALTAVLHADSYLFFPDFRAVERTYGLLTQVAGRAGRGDDPGKVVIQTYHPDHYAIRAALYHDDEGFAREEMEFRRVFHYPPFARVIQLMVRDRSRERGEARIAELAHELEPRCRAEGVRMAGPAPAPLERLRGKWRFQIVVRGPSAKRLRAVVNDSLTEPPSAELVIDVDPYDLL